MWIPHYPIWVDPRLPRGIALRQNDAGSLFLATWNSHTFWSVLPRTQWNRPTRGMSPRKSCWCKYKKKTKKHNSYHFTREQTIIEDSPDSPAFSMADSGGEVVVCCQASASTGGNQRLYPGYSLHAPWLLVFHNGKEGETANRIYPEHRYRCSNSIRPATSYLVFTAPASYCIITFRSGPPSSSALWTDSNASAK